MILRTGPGTIAEGIALQRFAETMLPEDIRIFSDPYAIHFLDPGVLAWARDHPAETKAIADEIEQKMPGWSNTIRGRIRYFDDAVRNAPHEGFSQMVILGAGYDTRAYRIGTLDGCMRIFEIDQPEILERKAGILRKIFGYLPGHVSFIPLDMAQENCWDPLRKAGWSPEGKTLFLLEGFVMYLPQPAVEDLLSGIARHAGAGSAVIFDFLPRSLADGSSDAEGGQNIRDWTIRIGEPILSGFADGEVMPFLAGLGYSDVRVITSRDFSRMYYTGKNADRKVSGLMSIVYAGVGPGAGCA
jgi:methyltransferase (TIGR00027 family)